jgi:hypothetical protein
VLEVNVGVGTVSTGRTAGGSVKHLERDVGAAFHHIGAVSAARGVLYEMLTPAMDHLVLDTVAG